MIYTITLNPSLDCMISLQNPMVCGNINRADDEMVFAGGKGINVSRVLKNFNHASAALCFIAKDTGAMLKHMLDQEGIANDLIQVKDGMTRINIKISDGRETEINGPGPHITEEETEQLFQKISELGQEDVLVLSGSIPSSMDAEIYQKLASAAGKNGCLVIIDGQGEGLLKALQEKPFLIKPNTHELEDIFSRKVETEEEIVDCAVTMQYLGARNVLVSRGSEGAVLINENGEVFSAEAPPGKVVQTIGSGDSMVAAFLAVYLETKNYEKAFRMAVAAGSASAFSKTLTTRKEAEDLEKLVSLQKRREEKRRNGNEPSL